MQKVDSERERLVVLEGALNCRDLGGYPAAGERVTRWGRVYRSDALDQLTDDDLDRIEGLGIRLVIDFRVDREVDAAPTRIRDHPRPRRQRLPVGGDEVDGRSVLETILAGDVKTYTVAEMAAV